MQQGRNGTGDLFYIDQGGRAERVGKCSHGVDWREKCLWYITAILQRPLSKNDISHKIHHESNEKLESGMKYERKIFIRGENAERCADTIPIFHRKDAIQLHT